MLKILKISIERTHSKDNGGNIMFKLELSKVSKVLIEQSNIFECDLKTAWEKWMHPAITEQFTYEEVMLFIEENKRVCNKC